MSTIYQIEYLSREYPLALRDLADAPSVISVEGGFDFDSRPVLAVVGARHSSVMAEIWMRRHLGALSDLAVIVSGGARGIDELAHQIAVDRKRPTAVILPSGLSRPYPSDWTFRKRDVLQAGGCFISEYPPESESRQWHFEKRNRLIAALADVVLVVEARHRSGTSITARHAAGLGRGIAALPWFPGDPRGEFCNELLCRGATPVRDASDVAALLARESAARSTRLLRASHQPFQDFFSKKKPAIPNKKLASHMANQGGSVPLRARLSDVT